MDIVVHPHAEIKIYSTIRICCGELRVRVCLVERTKRVIARETDRSSCIPDLSPEFIPGDRVDGSPDEYYRPKLHGSDETGRVRLGGCANKLSVFRKFISVATCAT